MENHLLYLFSPSNSHILPPIESTVGDLPIEQLAWEDFEKLSLRLAQTKYSIHDCEIFGTKGQGQEGIDIYAKKTTGKYATYQCKRYESISVSVFDKAVNEFSRGLWAPRSDEFIFCTSSPMNSADLQLKFEDSKDQLRLVGIDLIKYDRVQINRLLKDYPEIVYDFFGKEWVRMFNGKDMLDLILEKRTIDSQKLIQYRKELFAFYSVVFNNYDIGIPSLEIENQTFELQERFILQDAYIGESEMVIGKSKFEKKQQRVESREYEDIYENALPKSRNADILKELQYEEQEDKSEFIPKQRSPISDLIVQGKTSIVLGDPGSGKSTFLRNLVLDILSPQPKLKNIAQNLGECIPVWLPFAYITKTISSTPNANLEDILKGWLHSHGKQNLQPLFVDALNDERLLLVVDGIDEQTDISSAQQAISRIQIQAELKKTRVIYSGRPYGYRFLRGYFTNITEIHLLPFTNGQQRKFIFYWFLRWLQNDDSLAEGETNLFLDQISKSSELKSLAENPLLLSILITQKIRDSVLPTNKIKALEAITEYLINTHPKKRIASANIISSDKFDFELVEVFLLLAYYVQRHYPDGVIDKSNAKEIIGDYLQEHMGYVRLKAMKSSEDILGVGANEYGIIIEKSNDQIAFSHRLFQEFLTSKYLSQSEDEFKQSLQAYGGNSHWHQVIKFYFGLIPSTKPKHFRECVELIGKANPTVQDQHQITFLKYDVVLTLNNAPIELSRQYLVEICDKFEFESNFKIKKVLWEIILESLHNPKIRKDVLSFVLRYYPNNFKYDDYRVKQLRWYDSNQLTENHCNFLIKILINGNYHQKLDASKVINVFADRESLLKVIVDILENSVNPELIPFALNCITSERLSGELKAKYLNMFHDFLHPDIMFFVIKLKVHLKKHLPDDLAYFVGVLDSVNFRMKDEGEAILVAGWEGDEQLLSICLSSINTDRNKLTIDKDIAWRILFKCYNHKDEVIDQLIKELEQDYVSFGFGRTDAWEYIAHYFRENSRLESAVSTWIMKQKLQGRETAFASFVAKTPKMKKFFMERLRKDSFPHWSSMALVEGWPDDPEVIGFMKDYFRSELEARSYSAHHVPKVFGDEKAAGIAILEEIIFNRKAQFRDRAVQGLIDFDKDYFKEKLLFRFVNEELPLLSNQDIWSTYSTLVFILVQSFPDETIIRSLVFPELVNKHEYFHLILGQYRGETDVIDQILNKSLPLYIDFRVRLVEKLGESGISDAQTIEHLSDFGNEASDTVSCTAAVAYFNYHKNEVDRIIPLSRSSAIYRGFSYESQRLIGLSGYLIARKLSDYLDVMNQEGGSTDPIEIFHAIRVNPGNAMIKTFVDNFDYLMSVIYLSSSEDEKWKERFWSFWSKYTSVSSQSYPHLMNYIYQSKTSLRDLNILDFLNRTNPQSITLKNAALQLVNESKTEAYYASRILGENFKHDTQVYSELIDINNFRDQQSKIVALCIGWPKDPILKTIFEQAINQPWWVGRELGYQLKFLFRTGEEIMEFMNYVINNYREAKHEYQYFIQPLLRRIRLDLYLQEQIKNSLLKSTSTSEEISFYHILSRLNKTDAEIMDWKQKQIESNDRKFGYDILTNRIDSLTEQVYNFEY